MAKAVVHFGINDNVVDRFLGIPKVRPEPPLDQ